MCISRPSKLHRKRCVESTWIFRPSKSHRKSTRKWSGNSSKFGLQRIDVISTSNPRRFDVVCPLGISLWTETFMTPLDELLSLNLIFIRFTTPALIKNNDSASESWTLPPPMKKAKKFWKQSNWEKIFHSQKLTCYRLDETGKTYPKQGKKLCKRFDRKVQYGK